jgi:hypothetical protein
LTRSVTLIEISGVVNYGTYFDGVMGGARRR